MDVRPIRPEEADRFLETTSAAFHSDLAPHDRERWRGPLEPPRSVAAFDGASMVATAGVYTREMSVPGTGPVPAAHVTMVGVLPTHRRRGLLRRLLGRLHAEAPEAFAVLWASEASIYGRFGYGPAARAADLEVATARARVREDAPPALPARLAVPRDVGDVLRAVHAAVLPRTPGMPDRARDAWWDRLLADPEPDREGASALRAAVLEDGRGYVLYRVKPGWEATDSAHTCVVQELLATDPQARAALWHYLLGLDLVRKLTWEGAPADEPLGHLLVDRRAVSVSVSDALWVAVLDVPRALTARRCSGPVDVVLDVTGREQVRLRAGADGATSCDPAVHAPPDLRLGPEALGAVFLGGTTVAELHGAGRVQELRPGAVAEATRALRADREPWCPEVF
jgi:predicted acetyltransferase